jgi:hypothetical protein
MTSTNFYQLNLDGSIYNSITFSSLPLSPAPPLLGGQTNNSFFIYNEKIYILLKVDISGVGYPYLYIFDINCNFLNNVELNFTAVDYNGIYIYNDKIFTQESNTDNLYIYNLNGSLLQTFSVLGLEPKINFNKNIALCYTTSNFYQYSLDTLNLIASIPQPNVPPAANIAQAYINYSTILNSIFFIYSNSLNVLYIYLISGNRLVLNNPVVVNAPNVYLCSFVKNGYLVLLTGNGLSIYNQNLKLIYSNSFTTTNTAFQYLTYNSSNIFYISETSTLNILNYNIKQPVNNPVYPSDFNLILGCKC